MQQCAAPQAECRAPHKRVAEPCRAVPCRARDLILGRRIFQTHRKAALSTLQWPRWPHSLGWPAVNLASIKSCHGIIGFWTRLIVCVCVAVPGVWHAHCVAAHGQVAGHGLGGGLLALVTVQCHRAVRLAKERQRGPWGGGYTYEQTRDVVYHT